MLTLEFLWSYKYAVLIAILVATLLGCVFYINILRNDVVKVTSEKAIIVKDLSIAQSSVIELQSDIGTQNTAITKLQTDADARVASHKAAIQIATKQAESYKQQALNLMKLIANPTESKCDAVNDIINSQITTGV